MTSPRIHLICVGSELLTDKVNTHTVLLGQLLHEAGFHLEKEITLGDNERTLVPAIRKSLQEADVVITAGGLGPTFDDLTRECWAKVLRRPLLYKAALVSDIKARFRSRGLRMPAINRRQGFVLKGAEVIPNIHGTAPGQFLDRGNKCVFLLPGPANELKPMVHHFLLSKLRHKYGRQNVIRKQFHMVGAPESEIDELVRPLVSRHQGRGGVTVTHAILASQAVITVRFDVSGGDVEQLKKERARLTGLFRRRLRKYMYGEDGLQLEEVVGLLLRMRQRTLAVAESCTGGLLSKKLTDFPGSSDYFLEGVISYSNKSKMTRLGVSKNTLERFGAVSRETARQMALGIRRKAGADYALSVTGVAGPGGGSRKKPVGLVYVGLATPRGTEVRELRLKGDRSWIRLRTALTALDMLRRRLIKG